MTVSEGVRRGDLVAELAQVVGARHEARFIVDEVTAGARAPGPAGPGAGLLDEGAVDAAHRMAARRAAGEPLQYVFGHWPFRRLDLLVDPRVLIPRPETEQVVEVALAEARRAAATRPSAGGIVVVDAGTGSGAIALSMATELGTAGVREVWATDASAQALAVAASNLDELRRHHDGTLPPVAFAEGCWLEPLPVHLRGAVDLVVSNPPYVSAHQWEGLDREVRAEPREALVSAAGRDGTPGLAEAEAVLEQASRWLGDPGAVVLELAPDQVGPAARLAARLGYRDVEVHDDLAGRPRALVARWGAER